MGSTARFLGLAAVFLIVVTAGAAQDSRQITVGGQDTVTASVSNPLTVPDVLQVRFNGPAVSSEVIDVKLPDSRSQVECRDTTETCRVFLGPDQDRELEFTIEGVSAGKSTFMVSVSSETTGKRSEATMAVTVTDQERSGTILTVLKRLLGIG
ncbi:MAG: hypothetical protein SVY41_03130 [Candidatus Nanohaloarchaea archaeon]|nr:hypothetical protein [Candidatus Nanohaloarchaea archaeon]